jgi:hypothetical protein
MTGSSRVSTEKWNPHTPNSLYLAQFRMPPKGLGERREIYGAWIEN